MALDVLRAVMLLVACWVVAEAIVELRDIVRELWARK